MAAEAFKLEPLIKIWDTWGLTDVFLPFLLVFVIVYAILQKTHILGEGRKNLNAVLAIVVALLFVIPHVTDRYPPDADPVVIVNNALPQVSIVLVAVIFLLILIGVFGQDMVFLGVAMPGWITFISFVVIIIIFGGAAGWWESGFDVFLEETFGSEAIAIVIMLLVFGILISWITSESKEEKSLLNKVGIDFSKLFGKK